MLRTPYWPPLIAGIIFLIIVVSIPSIIRSYESLPSDVSSIVDSKESALRGLRPLMALIGVGLIGYSFFSRKSDSEDHSK